MEKYKCDYFEILKKGDGRLIIYSSDYYIDTRNSEFAITMQNREDKRMLSIDIDLARNSYLLVKYFYDHDELEKYSSYMLKIFNNVIKFLSEKED